jgi:hypothetical protein
VVSFDACKRPELWETMALGGSLTKNCGAVWRCFCEKKERRGCGGGGLYIARLGLVGKLGFARGGGSDRTEGMHAVLGAVTIQGRKKLMGGSLMSHKYRGCIIVLSVNKSVEPNEEQKVLTSGFDQGFTVNTSKRVFRGIWQCK